jgi:hypothetical protein
MKTKLTFVLITTLAACSSHERSEPADVAARREAPQPGPAVAPGGGIDHPSLACAFGQGALPDGVRRGVERALGDEWQSEARYEAFSAKFGRPFPNLERAEERHADVLLKLLSAHGHAAPPRPETRPQGPETVADACAVSLEAEKKNVALYDELIAESPPDDVRCVYEHLRSRSADKHIPALERCGGRP